MTQQELDERARQRAVDERLKTWRVAGKPLFLVKSRLTDPGAMHEVHVEDAHVISCTCAGWFHRRSCTHAQAVMRRLEREGRRRAA